MLYQRALDDILDESDLVPRAVLSRSLNFFADKFGWEIVDGCDDLDYYQGIGLILGDSPVVLIHYRGHRADETTVLLPINAGTVREIGALFGRLADELRVSHDMINWEQKTDDPKRSRI